jgi:hypothetical protein
MQFSRRGRKSSALYANRNLKKSYRSTTRANTQVCPYMVKKTALEVPVPTIERLRKIQDFFWVKRM